MTTNTAAFMGLLSATALNWMWDGKPDLGMSINGCLAGLVAITAPCAFVTVNAALIIGLLAGFIVVCAVKLCDAVKIDDPVGAIPVHLFNGVFGTICVGLFAVDKITGAATGNGLFTGGGATLLIAQLQGIAAVGVYTLAASFVFWYAIKMLIGLRVGKDEEEEGLDIGEHGQVAYTSRWPSPEVHTTSGHRGQTRGRLDVFGSLVDSTCHFCRHAGTPRVMVPCNGSSSSGHVS